MKLLNFTNSPLRAPKNVPRTTPFLILTLRREIMSPKVFFKTSLPSASIQQWNNFNVGHPASESKSRVLPSTDPHPRILVVSFEAFLFSPALSARVFRLLCRGIREAQVGQHDVQLDLYNLSALPAMSRSACCLIKRPPGALVAHTSLLILNAFIAELKFHKSLNISNS